VVFGGPAPLVIEDIEDVGDRIVVRARTPLVAVACPERGVVTARLHGLCERPVADLPVDARRVQVMVLVRRLVCPTFRMPPDVPRAGPGVSCSVISGGLRAFRRLRSESHLFSLDARHV